MSSEVPIHQTSIGSIADVDVLVVGSGAAGLVAALSAHEAGASRVLIAEAGAVIGGSSRLSGRLMMGAGTRYQRAAGIVDDAAGQSFVGNSVAIDSVKLF